MSATYATVWTLPSIFALAKYDPDEPLEIILGCIPSEMASLTASTSLLRSVRKNVIAIYTTHKWKSSLVMGGLWSNVLTCERCQEYRAARGPFRRTNPSSTGTASICGANTLCHISLRELSSTFFFRFTFCAIDSVQLSVRLFNVATNGTASEYAHRLKAVSSLLKSMCPGRGARRSPREAVAGGGSTSPTSPSSSSSMLCVRGWYSDRSCIYHTASPGSKSEMRGLEIGREPPCMKDTVSESSRSVTNTKRRRVRPQ